MYATFDCTVSIVDEKRREAISKELYERRKADIGDTTAHITEGDDSEDEDLLGYVAVEPGLPPASSDRQKWWLDNKQPARANVNVPSGRNGQPMSLNPNRPSNPFGKTDEPDWVSVSRASPLSSAVSGSSPYGRSNVQRSQSTASNASSARKMPPPFDPSKLPGKVPGRMAIAEEGRGSVAEDGQQQPPPPPPPRRATAGMSSSGSTSADRGSQPHAQPLPLPPRRGSSASQASQASAAQAAQAKPAAAAAKSPPPPVAKKPAHLAGSSPVLRPGQLPARKPVAPQQQQQQQQQPQAPGLPRRPVAGAGASPNAGDRDAAGQVDLLGDGGGEEVGGWQTLEPSK